jgi:hypothetical protein
MISQLRTVLMLLFAIILWIGCGTSTSSETSDSGVDGSSDTDVDPDNPDENDMPIDLPALCQADIVQASASEKDDYVGDSKGDGRFPDIGFGDSALMTWAYRGPEELAVWEIQTTPYDPTQPIDPDAGVGNGQLGPAQNPFDPGPVAIKPAVAGRGDQFGVVWLDGQWDSECDQTDIDNCDMEVTFARVNAAGELIAGSDVLQVTNTPVTKILDRPDIAATASGYIIVWLEMDDNGTRVIATALDEKGQPLGTPNIISIKNNVETQAMPAVAAVGNTAVAVWGVTNQKQILARVLNEMAEPQTGIPTVLDEGILCINPRIVAGTSDFLVSWSKMRGVDQEVFTRKLDSTGTPIGEPLRITWTPQNVQDSVPAWDGTTYALAWLSAYSNGADECTVESCDIEVFTTLLDPNGALASEPVRLSNDPNSCQDMDVSWDGSGFTAVWTLPRGLQIEDFRFQVFYGRMTCD